MRRFSLDFHLRHEDVGGVCWLAVLLFFDRAWGLGFPKAIRGSDLPYRNVRALLPFFQYPPSGVGILRYA